MRKKILMLLGWYYPDSVGGTEKYVNDLSLGLKELGCNVEIAAPSSKVDKLEQYYHSDIKVYRYPVSNNKFIKNQNNTIAPVNFNIFKDLINYVSPDLIHMHSLVTDCGIYHARFIKERDIPFVFTIHLAGVMCPRGTFMRWGNYPCDTKLTVNKCASCLLNFKGIPKTLSRLLILFQFRRLNFFRNIPKLNMILGSKNHIDSQINKINELFTISDCVVVVSNWLKETIELNQFEIKKMLSSSHGISYEKDSNNNIPGKKEDKLIFSYIGRFYYLKGVEVLLKAFKKIGFKNIELRLYGYADTEEQKAYLYKLNKLANGDSRINFMGKLDDNNKEEIMKSVDVLIVPSICYETGPLVVLEAFHHGIPVIGSNLGGISELVANEKNGLLFAVGDVNDLKLSIERIVYEDGLLDKLKSNIEPVRRNEEVVHEMNELYENILN